MTITDLDTLRADTMRAFLNDEGRTHVWKYDIVCTDLARRIAAADYDFDNLEATSEGLRTGKPFCLIGPGIVDAPFATEGELVSLLAWLCYDGYLSCYASERPTWRPHLEETHAELNAWKNQ